MFWSAASWSKFITYQGHDDIMARLTLGNWKFYYLLGFTVLLFTWFYRFYHFNLIIIMSMLQNSIGAMKYRVAQRISCLIKYPLITAHELGMTTPHIWRAQFAIATCHYSTHTALATCHGHPLPKCSREIT